MFDGQTRSARSFPWGGVVPDALGRANGLEVNPRGQGPRAEAVAARRLPAFEARGAGGVPPFKYR